MNHKQLKRRLQAKQITLTHKEIERMKRRVITMDSRTLRKRWRNE